MTIYRTGVLILLLAAPLVGLERPPTIKEFKLRGTSAFHIKRLEQLIESRPRFLRKRVFDADALDRDIDNLMTFYQGEGYNDVRVVRRQVDPAADGRTVRILVELDEGPRTRVSRLDLDGAAQIAPDTLRALLKIKAGKAFRQTQLVKDLRRLQEFYAERGMVNAQVSYRALQDSGHTVRLVYQIDEGPPVRVGAVVLDGLDKTRPRVVQREVRLRPGDLLRYSQIRKTQSGIYATGLFRTVLVEPGPLDPARPAVRDLQIILRERRAGSLDMGLGYGTSERLRAGLSIAQDNWLGRGMQVGFSIRASQLLRKVEVAYTAPRLTGRPLALDVRTFYEWERNREADFTTQSVGGELTLSYLLGRGWLSEIKYLLEQVELLTEGLRGVESETRNTSSFGAALSRDSRDDLLNPESGSFLRGDLAYAGGLLQGENSFLRTGASATHYRRLGSFVWAGRGEIRHIRPLGGKEEEIVAYERFYLGGDRSVRGYARQAIGADRIGLAALGFQSEVRFPMWRVDGVAFVDGGQVWQRFGDVDPAALRLGYGGGLRYAAPFGMLRLDVGLGDGDGSVGERLEIYLGIGQGF